MSRTLAHVVMNERAIRQRDNAEGSAIKNMLAKEALTLGSVKTYRPKDDDGEQLPTEHEVVQRKVEDDLLTAARYSVAAMDIVATKDMTNTTAYADIVVNGTVMVAKVPIGHLLWLEDYLTEWRGFLAVLPVLNPTKKWTFNPDDGIWRSDPEERDRNLKRPRALVLHEGTDRHAPQATTYIEETPVGRYSTVMLSGAISEARKRELLDKVDAVRLAVKSAIAEANKTTAIEVTEGQVIMDFILGHH